MARAKGSGSDRGDGAKGDDGGEKGPKAPRQPKSGVEPKPPGIRSEMVELQGPPNPIAKKKPRKAKPKTQTFEHRGVSIETTSTCRPSHLKLMCREIRRLMRAGEWSIKADIVHVSGPDRGKKPG